MIVKEYTFAVRLDQVIWGPSPASAAIPTCGFIWPPPDYVIVIGGRRGEGQKGGNNTVDYRDSPYSIHIADKRHQKQEARE